MLIVIFFSPPLSFSTALTEVAEFLAAQTLSVDTETVSFTQHFPRLAHNPRLLLREG